jgi:hypothetical protein
VADYAAQSGVGSGPAVPRDSRGKREPRDGLVVAPEQAADLQQRPVGGDLRASGAGHVPGYVCEDLAPLSIDAKYARGAFEARPLEVAQ